MANEQRNNPFTSGQQGSGSAENLGENRDTQKAQNTQLDKSERQDIGEQAGLGRDQITDLSEMGALSGRDDASGGSGDEMEKQDTDRDTDR